MVPPAAPTARGGVGSTPSIIDKVAPPAARCADTMHEQPLTLFPEEELAIRQAVPKRREEYISGRWCAGQALAALGVARTPIVSSADRAPVWPDGIVGSITHCPGYRAAAVARACDLAALGIDAEPDERLPRDVRPLVAAAGEIEALPLGGDTAWDRVLFSAKEAVFKAWFPRHRRMLDFHDVWVELHVDGTFSTDLLGGGTASERRFVSGLGGSWHVERHLVVTAAYLPNGGGA